MVKPPGSARRCGTRPPRVGGPRRLLGLPEDGRAAPDLGEHELGASKARPVEHQVDRRTPPTTGEDRDLLQYVGLLRPVLLERVAVDAGAPRPGVADLQPETALEGQPQEVGELRVRLPVPGDYEGSL